MSKKYSKDTRLSQLLHSFRTRDLEEIRRLVRTVDPNQPLEDNKTLADLAIEAGDIEVLELLREIGLYFTKVSGVRSDGRTLFQDALESENVEDLKTLVKCGVDPNATLPSGEYPLLEATSFLNTDILSALIEETSINLQVFDAQNNSVLQRACLEDSVQHVKVILPHCDSKIINHQDCEGKTALHIAVLNQNRVLVKLLLEAGARTDIAAGDGKTAIDAILSTNSELLINDLVQNVSDTGSDGPVTIPALTHRQDFVRYLEFLKTIDNEHLVCDSSDESADEEDSSTVVLSKILKDKRIDLLEFRLTFVKLLKSKSIHQLNAVGNEQVIRKLSLLIANYVLFREDEDMLKVISSCGVIWSNMRTFLSSQTDALFLHAPKRGVFGDLKDKFAPKHRLNRKKMCQFFGRLCKIHKLPVRRKLDFNADLDYMQHPMDTLVVWSILSGRHKLTLELLQQVQFDVLPLSLFCAALLRSLINISSFQVNVEQVEILAEKCEEFAYESLELTLGADTSNLKEITINYLLMPLPTYGYASCLELAAQNDSAKFLQSPAGQQALDKLWYGSLDSINSLQRLFLICLGLTPITALLIPPIIKRLAQKERKKFLDASDDEYDKHELRFNDGCFDTKTFTAEDDDDEANDHLATYKFPLINTEETKNGMAFENQKPEVSQTAGENAEKGYVELLCMFYKTPGIKFMYYTMSHVCLVMILSYILLLDLEFDIDLREITAYTIILGFALEEAKEVWKHAVIKDISLYFSDKWNLIDLLAMCCSLVAFCIRMFKIGVPMDLHPQTYNLSDPALGNIVGILHSNFEDNMWYATRVFLSIACMLYWLRLLYISTVMETLGPKLKMIGQMITNDLFPFLLILFIFIFGFGVLIHGLLFPNGYKAWNPLKMTFFEILMQMFALCFYSMVGDYSMDLITGADCESTYEEKTMNKHGSCPHSLGRFIVPYAIMPLYVIVTEILLLNLIIALFSKTIDEIDNKAKALWQFERYDLISQYVGHTTLPPPLNIPILACQGLVNLLKRCTRKTQDLMKVDPQGIKQFLLFQAMGLRGNRRRIVNSAINENIIIDH